MNPDPYDCRGYSAPVLTWRDRLMVRIEQLRERLDNGLDLDPDQLIVIVCALIGAWWFTELCARLVTGG